MEIDKYIKEFEIDTVVIEKRFNKLMSGMNWLNSHKGCHTA